MNPLKHRPKIKTPFGSRPKRKRIPKDRKKLKLKPMREINE